MLVICNISAMIVVIFVAYNDLTAAFMLDTVFRRIWISRDIIWADVSMLPCFFYWKG